MTEKSNPEKSNLKEYIELVVEETLLAEAPRGRLRDIFIQPVKDVLNTGAYAASRISATAQTVVKGLFYILHTILLPGLEFDYDTFMKDEQKHLDSIKKKYGEALASNWEALKNPDIFGFMFLANPFQMLGFAAIQHSPLAVLNILEAATGGYGPVRRAREWVETSAAFSPRTTQHNDPAGGSWGGEAGTGGFGALDGSISYGGLGMGESVLRENANPEVTQQIQALLQDPNVKQALAKSPMFREMQNAAVQIMVAPAARFMQSQTLDQMKGAIDPAAIDKAKQAIEQNAEYQKGDDKTKQAAIQDLVAQAKKMYKEEYIKWLQGLIQKNPQAGPVVQQAITQINALS